MKFLRVGRHALLVEVVDVEAARATYAHICDLLERGDSSLARPRDVVPAARTVLLDGLAGEVDVASWVEELSRLDERAVCSMVGGREVEIVASYDGPDLDLVAQAWECDRRELVRRHSGATFTVAFCGFAPGFAYCTSDLALPDVPRRAEPRSTVPAGSVGVAGQFCAVYPRTMPGGWMLIATTREVMFDAARDQPALLRPGDRVRFAVRS